MKQTHDIFVRAYAIPAEQQDKRKKKGASMPLSGEESKWPKKALIFDTQSRITPDQSLTFGVYRLCDLIDGEYVPREEGVFYSDDLPSCERQVLETYQLTAIPDMQSFPPSFPAYPLTELMKKIFWLAMVRRGALACGFNMPFDLSRLALDWTKGDKNEWSLTMRQYADGVDNKNYPHILIQPIDSKKAFIRLATPWQSKQRKKKRWKKLRVGRFLDLRTLEIAKCNRERRCQSENHANWN